MNKEGKNFFEAQTYSSKIKANIVSEYFPKYSNILLTYPQNQIEYIDLFAGPGQYEDGNLSTPLLIGKAIANDPKLKNVVRFIFNDNQHCRQLESNFKNLFPENTFPKTPFFGDKTVGEDDGIDKFLTHSRFNQNGKNPFPALLFIDPFGYKGINTTVLATFLKNWGNEIFLFLNIKRIHAATENGKFDELMNNLFPTTINQLRLDRKYTLSVNERLLLIIENLEKEYKSILNTTLFCSTFKFKEEDSKATSHYILHFTKNKRGYDLIKQIYHEFDNIGATLENDGTYTFDAKQLEPTRNDLIDFGDENILALKTTLHNKYKGRKLSALQLFEEHQTGTKFSRKHYTLALRSLVEEGKLKANYNDSINHIVSVLLTNKCILQFN